MRNLEQRLIYSVWANGFGLTIFRQIADIPLDDVASANKTEWTCQVVTKVIVLYVDVASRGSQLSGATNESTWRFPTIPSAGWIVGSHERGEAN